MAGPLPLSYLDILRDNSDHLNARIQRGELKPVFLWHSIVFLLPVSALLVPHRNGARYVRPLILILLFSLALKAIRYRRMLLGANGYMVGLIAAWWLIWCASLLVFHDAEREFKRIVRKPAGRRATRAPVASSKLSQNGFVLTKGDLKEAKPKILPSQHDKEYLVWQSYPHSFSKRLNWSLGLVFNMRGPEWNWGISSLDPLPPSVESQLKPGHRSRRPRGAKNASTSYPDARNRIRTAAFNCLKFYLMIDLIKVLMIRDRYFWGIISPPPPLPFPFDRIIPAGAAYIYRTVLTGFGLYAAVSFVTLFSPLTFLGLSLLFPNASRAISAAPLDAPWFYSDMFGPYVVPILDHGLAGAWGIWWHQLFRFGFTSTAHWILSFFPNRLAANRSLRRLVMTFVAFGLSGLVHACGSYTQMADTKPVSGTFWFFILQFVGITIQEFISAVIIPAVLFNLNGFVFGWLWLTAGYVMDDFAKGGLWLTEPLPTGCHILISQGIL
ncbi:hypothetical protein BBP40_006307 [Aspergillus hancockii]|nr:hypothetical protein BBP40_006307 [Aspergillus hancockii]